MNSPLPEPSAQKLKHNFGEADALSASQRRWPLVWDPSAKGDLKLLRPIITYINVSCQSTVALLLPSWTIAGLMAPALEISLVQSTARWPIREHWDLTWANTLGPTMSSRSERWLWWCTSQSINSVGPPGPLGVTGGRKLLQHVYLAWFPWVFSLCISQGFIWKQSFLCANRFALDVLRNHITHTVGHTHASLVFATALPAVCFWELIKWHIFHDGFSTL